MKTSDFDFQLPEHLIAQEPASPRDHSKLMRLNKNNGEWHHHHFYDLPDLLTENDVLVFNNTKVDPIRLFGQKKTGGKVELLLEKRLDAFTTQVMTKPGLKPGQAIYFFHKNNESQEIVATATVKQINPDGLRLLQFDQKIEDILPQIGTIPLPPYITRYQGDQQRYQTVYAKETGSMAAPTAGLHFTPKLLEELQQKGVQLEYLTLHVGLGTFQPLQTEDVNDHHIHTEFAHMDQQTAQRLNQAKQQGKRIIAVGTTSLRTLEHVAGLNRGQASLHAFRAEVDLYITPGYQFRFINALITNFHTPKSTLMVLVSALAGYDVIRNAYQEAIQQEYRFFSFGDGMFIE